MGRNPHPIMEELHGHGAAISGQSPLCERPLCDSYWCFYVSQKLLFPQRMKYLKMNISERWERTSSKSGKLRSRWTGVSQTPWRIRHHDPSTKPVKINFMPFWSNADAWRVSLVSPLQMFTKSDIGFPRYVFFLFSMQATRWIHEPKWFIGACFTE